MWHRGLLRYILSTKKGTAGFEWTPVVSIPNVLYCLWLSFGYECVSVLAGKKKKKYWPSKHTLLLRAVKPIIALVFLLTIWKNRSLHSHCDIKDVIMHDISKCIWWYEMSVLRMHGEQAYFWEFTSKTGSLWLVKSFPHSDSWCFGCWLRCSSAPLKPSRLQLIIICFVAGSKGRWSRWHQFYFAVDAFSE